MRHQARPRVDEFSQLIDNLSTKNFVALSPGIGLGEVRAAIRLPELEVKRSSLPDREIKPPVETVTLPPVPTLATWMPTPKPHAVVQKKHRVGRWPRLIVAHAADILVVGASLICAFLAAGLVFAPRGIDGGLAGLTQWEPVKFLLQLSYWQVLIGVYVVFAIYWIFFRFVAGGTLGQSWFMSVAEQNVSDRIKLSE